MLIDMCANFGKDQNISFQVRGKKANALPTMDGRRDRRTDEGADGRTKGLIE